MNHAEVAIVGAGIVGLAHALAAAKKGFKVVVFDRSPQAVGASIRNFGMVWPIGQPVGQLLDRALRSREIWIEVAGKADFHADQCGSIHLAYREDEMAVLEEFVKTKNIKPTASNCPEDIFVYYSSQIFNYRHNLGKMTKNKNGSESKNYIHFRNLCNKYKHLNLI